MPSAPYAHPPARPLRSAWLRLFLVWLALVATTPAFATKTDWVQLVNGDRITCEIQKLERGRLRVGTDSMGTVYFEWNDVVRLSSPAQFVVELADGRKTRGQLSTTAVAGQVKVRRGEQEHVFELQEVVWIDLLKVEGSIGDLWDASFSIGLDFTRTNNDTAFTGSFDARRRAEHYGLRFNGSAYLRSQDNTEDSQRMTLAGEYRRFGENRWFWSAGGAFERNEQLGIDLRSLAGIGYGRYLVQTGTTLWSATAGVAVVNEQRAGEEASASSVEAVLSTDYEIFIFDSPKTSLNTSFTLYPSLTDTGRVRADLDVALRHELVADLFFELNFYGSHDSRPPDSGEKSDYGFVTGLGYSF